MDSVVTPADENVPFDETAVTRGRHKCYFCDVHRSDEWKFIARLNAFICKPARNASTPGSPRSGRRARVVVSRTVERAAAPKASRRA